MTGATSKLVPAALDFRNRGSFGADGPLPAVRTVASNAGAKFLHNHFWYGSEPVLIEWAEWGVDIFPASFMAVLGGTAFEPVAKVRADVIGRVRFGHSEVNFDITISREGTFFINPDSDAVSDCLDGVNCRDFVDDLFGLPEHDPKLLEAHGRQKINWLMQDFPEITVSLYGVVVRPTVDVHQAIHTLLPEHRARGGIAGGR